MQLNVSTLLITVGLRNAPSIAGNGGLIRGPAALAFEALDQAGFLAADVRPGASVDVDIEAEIGPIDVLPQVPRRSGLGDGGFEAAEGPDVLEPDVDIGRARLGGEAGNLNPFEHLVRVEFEELPVVERRRLALVGVDAHEGFRPVFGEETPLQPGREPGAASTAQLRILDDPDHLVGVQFGQSLSGGRVSPALLIHLQGVGIGDVPVPGQNRFKVGHDCDLQKGPRGGSSARLSFRLSVSRELKNR